MISLADKIKKYKIEALIDFLRKKENLDLDNNNFEIIRKQKIMSCDFFKMTDDKFEYCEFEIGLVSRLADFAKKCKDKKKRAFFSYCNLKKVFKNTALRIIV